MKLTLSTTLAIAACCSVTSFAFATEIKCEYFVKVDSGAYGAVDTSALNDIRTATIENNHTKIAELLRSHKINKIDTDNKLCVISTEFDSYSKVVLLPEDNTQYYVDDKATTVVKCERLLEHDVKPAL